MKKETEHDISDYNYIGSAIGNAYFSGLSFDQLWSCVKESKNREQLDAAVLAMSRLIDLTKRK